LHETINVYWGLLSVADSIICILKQYVGNEKSVPLSGVRMRR
jgi:hypothetical protein